MLSNDANGKKKSRKKKVNSLPANAVDNTATIKKFNDYYDDSSDEETVTNRNNNYNVKNAWQKKHLLTPNSNENEFLSFIAHSAGLQMLYSSEVNQIYYPLKSVNLKNAAQGVIQLHNLIQAAILQIILNSCDAVKTFISVANQKDKYFDNPSKIAESFFSSCQVDIVSLIKEHLNDLILSIKKSHSETNIKLSEALQSALKKILLNTFRVYCEKYSDKDDEDIQAEDDFFQFCKNKISEIVKELNLTSQNTSGKSEALTKLNAYKGNYLKVAHALKKRLNHCRAVGSVESIMLKEFERDTHWQKEMLLTLQTDLALQIKNHTPLDFATKTIIKKYFKLHRNNLEKVFTLSMNIFLEHKIANALKFLYRPTLDRTHHFFSRDSYEFYANLRLSNRSQKRQALNMKYGIFQQDSAVRSWGFFPKSENRTAVIELQQITGKNLSRKDLVTDLGSYDRINLLIKQLRDCLDEKYKPLTDKEIALWIREVFHGNEPKLADNTIDQFLVINKLEAIAFLLFGCEAARNPSMIVINQMLLDLIIEHPEYDFNHFFSADSGDEKRAPMAPQGAVAVARALESHYRNYMPHPYVYSGIEDDKEDAKHFTKNDLINAEANIVKTWLKMKFGKTIKRDITKQDTDKILNCIQSGYSAWFRKPNDDKKRLLKNT